VEERKFNLILNVGPPRTGTTYLFDLFYNSPKEIKNRIVPQSDWKFLDKHVDRYYKGKISFDQLEMYKMHFKEQEVKITQSHFNQLIDHTDQFDYYLKHLQNHTEEFLYINDPRFLLTEQIPQLGFRNLGKLNSNNLKKLNNQIDKGFHKKSLKFDNFFNVCSTKFNNIYLISCFRNPFDLLSSFVNLVITFYNRNQFNDTISGLLPYLKIYDILQNILQNTSGIENIHPVILDFKKLNDIDYMYNKFDWLFDNKQYLKDNPIFGKKVFASRQNARFELPQYIKDFYETSIINQKEFFDKYIHAD